MLDLLIRNGTVVVPNYGAAKLNIGITGGKIVYLSEQQFDLNSLETIDASGLHMLPGIFDPHIHLGIFGPLETEAETETRAALLGGITTLGSYMGLNGSYLSDFPDIERVVEQKTHVDVLFHLEIRNEMQQREMERYVNELGVRSFKQFMCGQPGLIPHVEDSLLLQTFKLSTTIEKGITVCVHAENASLVETCTAEIYNQGGSTLQDWFETRPAYVEEEAILRAAFLAKLAGARLYIVHLSSKLGVEALKKIRAEQSNVFVETVSPYLSITKDTELGLLTKMVPPIKEEKDREALWEAVSSDVVDTIATDNVSQTIDLKGVKGGLWETKAGYAVLATHLPVILTEGFHKRGLDIVKLVEKMTAVPARIFGLYPKKRHTTSRKRCGPCAC